MVSLVLALASYMMSKHVKLLRLGKKNAKEITTGSLDPAAIAADSCLEDPLLLAQGQQHLVLLVLQTL